MQDQHPLEAVGNSFENEFYWKALLTLKNKKSIKQKLENER